MQLSLPEGKQELAKYFVYVIISYAPYILIPVLSIIFKTKNLLINYFFLLLNLYALYYWVKELMFGISILLR